MSTSQVKICHIQRGLRLRELGLSYSAITIILKEYHGVVASESTVQHLLRRFGAPARPRGNGLANLRRGNKVPS